ncbi:MAG: acyl-CoA dehydrogenase [Saprospirales bacterium]|nr:MAG: acyl-CoA dehydrogenase [Saprospirales bacterium]
MDQETKVLKGGEFVISSSEPDHLFVPEDTNEEQKMIRQSCRDFVFSEVQKNGNEIANQHDLLKAAAELGLLGAHIPEQYGGTELDTNTNTMILEELGKGGGSYDTSFAAHTGIGMLPILYYGTEEQKKKYLPSMSDGSLIGAYCLTEPGSGSDALAAKSHAELTEDGKHYLLNGQKMWISNAGFAGVFIVFAKIDGEKFTAFIVDRDSEGVTLGEEEDKLGIKGSSTRQVFFENVKVPLENVLGELGKGHHIAFAVLNIGRFKLGAMCMGGSKLACEIGIQYANDRQQFGKPISSFGAIRYKIAEQAIRIFALESAVYRVSQLMQEMRAQMVAGGIDYATSLQKSAEEYAVECAIIKVVGSEVLDYVVDELVQIHGGYGFSEEYKPASIYRDSRINRIYEGTNEINRLLMVNMLLRKAEKGDLNLKDPAWNVQKELTKMPSFEKPSGKWAAETIAVENMKKIFLLTSGAAVKYQMDGKHDLRNEQMVLTNIADILIDMFVAESLLLRVQKSVVEENEELYRAILSTTISDAQYRISKNAKDALHSFASGDELRVMSMGVDRFTKYPHPNIRENRELIAAKLVNANAYSL